MMKPHLSIRATLLIIIGSLNALIAMLIGNGMYTLWQNYNNAQSLRQSANVTNALYDVNKNLSLERGAGLSVLYAEPESAPALADDLAQSRTGADSALEQAFNYLKNDRDPAISKSLARIHKDQDTLQQLRNDLDAALKQPLAERDPHLSRRVFRSTTDMVSDIQDFILIYTRPYQKIDALIAQQMRFKYFVWNLAEYAGEEYAIIGQLIAENKTPTPDQQEVLIDLRGRIQYGWDIIRKFALNDALAEKLLPVMEEAETHYSLTFDQVKDLFFSFQPIPEKISYPISTEMWLGMASQAVDSLLALQTEVLEETSRHVNGVEETMRRDMILNGLIFLCAIGLSLYCWSIIVFRVTRPVNAMVDALYKAAQSETYEIKAVKRQQDEISKLAHVLETFQENTDKIKRSNEELERFAYIAAHDLKSPLRAVDNLTQWLAEDLDPVLQGTDKEHMTELRKRVRLMDQLLDDTLEYARVGAVDSQSSIMVSGTTMVDEIKSLLAVPEGFAIRLNDKMARTVFPKMPLQQVLHNLVSNAIKHHDRPDGIIQLDLEEGAGGYTFTVMDDGPGIAPQYHQKIFEMFQTLTHDKTKGRGMGLAMVRKIVNTHGGTITVESTPGHGAVFRFTWPKTKPITREVGNDDGSKLYA